MSEIDRLPKRKVPKQCAKHYIEWSCSKLHHRPKQAQNCSNSRKVQMEPPESIRTSLAQRNGYPRLNSQIPIFTTPSTQLQGSTCGSPTGLQFISLFPLG